LKIYWGDAKEVGIDRRLQNQFAISDVEVMVDPLPFGVGVYPIADRERNATTTMDPVACREGTGEVSAEDIAMSTTVGVVVQRKGTMVETLEVKGCPGTFGTTVSTMVVPY
jgi:hypothetical protein